MKPIFKLSALVLFSFITSCANSPMETSVKSEENRKQMSFLKKGMSEKQVYALIGEPYQKGSYQLDQNSYEVWYYITRSFELGQEQPHMDNFTPIVFQKGKMIGFGKRFYNSVFDEKIRRLAEEERKEAYTDDEEEWPPGDHQVIPMTPSEEDKKAAEDNQTDENQPEDLQDVLDGIQKEDQKVQQQQGEEPSKRDLTPQEKEAVEEFVQDQTPPQPEAKKPDQKTPSPDKKAVEGYMQNQKPSQPENKTLDQTMPSEEKAQEPDTDNDSTFTPEEEEVIEKSLKEYQDSESEKPVQKPEGKQEDTDKKQENNQSYPFWE